MSEGIRTIAVLGCGNMSQALVKSTAQAFPELTFLTYTPSFTRAEKLAKELNGEAKREPRDLAGADVYLLACKPQQIDDLAKNFRGLIPRGALIISILAGTSVERIQKALDVQNVMRVMPNTPVLLGEGVNLLYFPKSLSEAHRIFGKKIMSAGARVYETQSEDQINALTGFTGSGPAYVFELTRILASEMTEYGVSREDAGRLAIQTVQGAAKLMQKNAKTLDDLEQLRDQVASKKGVTQKALESLEEDDLEAIFARALRGAYERAKELSR